MQHRFTAWFACGPVVVPERIGGDHRVVERPGVEGGVAERFGESLGDHRDVSGAGRCRAGLDPGDAVE